LKRHVGKLPPIPVIDARDGGPLITARAAEPQLRELLRHARRLVPPPLLFLADRTARCWLARSENPYLSEIDAIAAFVGRGGAHALNTSYEWCCTCGVGLLRVLDWRQAGLGRSIVVVWQRGPAGDFANVTWPGFVGVITAMAPGRFAVALNQPPMMSWGLTSPLDWLVGRCSVWRSRDLPPAHLLRQICETCGSYDQARQRLCDTPLCLPALFTLAGVEPGEGCVIERTQRQAVRRDMPAAVGNHWVGFATGGRARGAHSRERMEQMDAALLDSVPWMAPPIINRHTRLVAAINPARRSLTLQGWEKAGPATAQLTL
jgi:hypothetical protein